LTTFYFLSAVLHCCLQVTFQVAAFKINEQAGRFLGDIIKESDIPQNHALLVQNGELRLCGPDDWDKDIYDCPVVWEGRIQAALQGEDSTADPYATISTTASDVSSSTSSSARARATVVIDNFNNNSGNDNDDDDEADDDDDEDETLAQTRTVTEFVEAPRATTGLVKRINQVDVDAVMNGSEVVAVEVLSLEVNGTTEDVELSLECVEMLIWPKQMIRNTKREDVTFIAFQIWVLGMSVVAILNESIPHIIASLLTHLLATAWSGYQLYNTALFREEFQRSTIDSRRCGDVNLLPGYWQQRNAAEIGVLVVNGVSLLAMTFLSWRLVKTFGWQTFKRIGASLDINRVYKIVLTFSIGLQLASFFIIAAMVLWLDLLFTSPLGQRAQSLMLYKVLGIITCVVMIPWLCLGWFSVRRETKIGMGAFVLVSGIMIAGWAAMFASNTFRWTFTDWRFFSVMSTASSTLLLLTTILAIICFMNFGKGLKRFLKAQEPIPETYEQPTSARDVEKAGDRVDFPTVSPIPSYAVAFGGPRSTTTSPIDEDSTQRQHPAHVARAPSNASTRSFESAGKGSTQWLERSTSRGSENSAGAGRSYVTAGSHHVPTTTTKHHRDGSDLKKGWVIE